MDDVNWNAIAVAFGVIAIIGLFWWQPIKDYIGGIKMRQKRRGEIQHSLISQVVEFVEEGVSVGTFTREEATKEVYEPLKRLFNTHKDLYPSETWLKERIETRMKSGAHDPVDFKVKRKNMLGR